MKKKVFWLCLSGAPIGLTISVFITLIGSVAIGDGNYYLVAPELVIVYGSEINAVILQSVCSLLYGAVWAGASVIWDQEEWSLLRQTVTHLVIGLTVTFPVAYFMYWMPHNVAGILSYFSVFFGIYAVFWFGCYGIMKRRVRQMNEKMKENNF